MNIAAEPDPAFEVIVGFAEADLRELSGESVKIYAVLLRKVKPAAIEVLRGRRREWSFR